MKRIKLTQGQVAIVDDEDFEWLNQWKWFAKDYDGGFRASRNSPKINGKRTTILMYRVIMNAPTGLQVDHINHDTLDNRKANLRICTNTENQRNQLPRTGSSRFKGVCWHKQNNKWGAQIRLDGKIICLGYFGSEIEAAKVYNEAAIKYFGEFARLNFPFAGARRLRWHYI